MVFSTKNAPTGSLSACLRFRWREVNICSQQACACRSYIRRRYTAKRRVARNWCTDAYARYSPPPCPSARKPCRTVYTPPRCAASEQASVHSRLCCVHTVWKGSAKSVPKRTNGVNYIPWRAKYVALAHTQEFCLPRIQTLMNKYTATSDTSLGCSANRSRQCTRLISLGLPYRYSRCSAR